MIKNRSFHLILLTIATIAVYINSLDNSFVWDDKYVLVDNPYIKSLDNFSDFFLKKESAAAGSVHYYRPLRTLLYALEYRIWGLNAIYYHGMNLLFHLFNVFLVYSITRHFLSYRYSALICGLLFGVHPIMTEAVSNVTGRTDLMFSFFFLLSFYIFLRYREYFTYSPSQTEGKLPSLSAGDIERYRRSSQKSLFFVCPIIYLAYSCSILSKEMGITLPFILLLYDYLFMRKEAGVWLRVRARAFYIGLFAIMVSYVFVWFKVVGMPEKADYYGENFFVNMITMSKVYIKYISLLLWPYHQSARYDVEISESIFDISVLSSLVLLGGIFSLAYIFRNRSKVVTFSILWFFITLLPVSNITPLVSSMMGERFLYLPSFGFFLIIASGFSYLHTVSFEKEIPGRYIKRFALFFLSFLIVVYSLLTIKRNQVWTNNLTLFQDAVKSAPDSLVVRMNLVKEYELRGRYDLARNEYNEALRINKKYVEIYNRKGKRYYNKKDWKNAVKWFRKAINTQPAFPESYYNLGRVYIELGQWMEAEKLLKEVLRLAPGNPEAKRLLDHILQQKKEYETN